MNEHEHHSYAPERPYEPQAVLAYQQLSKLVTDYLLGNSGSVTPPSGWTMGLSTIAIASTARNSVWSAVVSGTNINEIGASTANGYARQTIARSIATGS